MLDVLLASIGALAVLVSIAAKFVKLPEDEAAQEHGEHPRPLRTIAQLHDLSSERRRRQACVPALSALDGPASRQE